MNLSFSVIQKTHAANFGLQPAGVEPGSGSDTITISQATTVIGSNIVEILLVIGGVLAVLYIVWAGFQYITSAGNSDRTKAARSGIINAVIGVVIIIAAFFIVRLASSTGKQLSEANEITTTPSFVSSSLCANRTVINLGKPSESFSCSNAKLDKGEVLIVVMEESNTNFSTGNTLADVEININDAGKFEKIETSDESGFVDIKNLQPGTYTITSKLEGYQDGSATIMIKSSSNKKEPGTLVILNMKNQSRTCKKIPQPNVSEFWFCGPEAQALYTKKPIAWKLIDARIGELRQKYPHNKTLPLQFIVESSSLFNGAYFSNISDSCPTSLKQPTMLEPSKDEEQILFTSEMLSHFSDTQLVHVVTHEWGHGKDLHAGKCSNFISDKDPFKSIYEKGGKSGIAYFDLLRDGAYDGTSLAGHPQDNPSEGYASAFHLGIDHAAEFTKKIRLNPLKDVLQKTVDTALKP